MSNLGFQTIYEHLNALPDAVCERVFFPDPEDSDEYARTGTEPFSLESLRPLRDFDVVGFSVTYEGDYINVLRLLAMAGIPARAADRGPGNPLVIMGGVCAFSNPEPLAYFMDAIAVGEGEELVGEIIAAYGSCRAGGSEDPPGESLRQRVIDRLKPLQGIYVPSAYVVRYAADGTIEAVAPREDGVPALIVKRRLGNVNRFETRSILKSPKAEYGHMQLLEVGKGCGRGCRRRRARGPGRCRAGAAGPVEHRGDRIRHRLASSVHRVGNGCAQAGDPVAARHCRAGATQHRRPRRRCRRHRAGSGDRSL
jgi:radical SAM superfamily enzyme YgiQ (UPF0313 family)